MARKGKRQPVGALQRLHDREVADRSSLPVVNAYAASHGDYDRNMRFVVNRGGTPLARWKRDGMLTETQQAAIEHCIRLWSLAETTTRVVANLDRTVFGLANSDEQASRVYDARIDIERIKDGFPFQYWNLFENVCRFDEPAGIAGSRLANDSSAASSHARLVVCMVADTIFMRERLTY